VLPLFRAVPVFIRYNQSIKISCKNPKTDLAGAKLSGLLLIVDDEPNLLRAVEAILLDENFEATTARNSCEALIQIAQNLLDLIISDVRMPGMDGYAFVFKMRSAKHSVLVPIVFFTVKGETEDRAQGFQASVDTYRTKPYEPDELVQW
jgi:DNA-binding response OmpR family regulator